jgi:hypothetical protein
MVDLDELCGVLHCCNDDDGEDDNDVTIYIGLAMFVVSEVLPFVGVKANGVLHFLISLIKR